MATVQVGALLPLALGFDVVLGNGTAAAPAFLLLNDAAVIQRTCLPPALAKVSSSAVPRPAIVPGLQLAGRLPTFTDCVDSASAPAMRRCWRELGMYTDTAAFATNLDQYGNVVLAGYILWGLRLYYLCETVMTDQCVATKGGPVGCFCSMFPTGPTKQSHEVPGASGRSRPLLAPLLGGTLGGLAAVAVAATVAVVVLRARRRRKDPGRTRGHDGKDLADWHNPLSPRRGKHPVSATTGSAEPSSLSGPVSDLELVPVTPLTPIPAAIDMDVRLGEGAGEGELQLLPSTLGKGAFGQVVVGLYGGQRVAVKLLNTGLALPRAEAAAWVCEAVSAVQQASAGLAAGDSKLAGGVAAPAVALPPLQQVFL
ncbi:hypothetical protein GPECTOR_12g495 [Gonium pectorale]|uniref:Protein kinase domain-containing protein n=1 Tax=Gonium pectorale TaxID=33097 RepID=A0A150GP69_GONPE|nr:hypothetical protein GPECTOR_12g495 [Gonium pectorale]|eukprot:KXZ51532.1 hypothetical protein GPECTOR_12g495 [Gonium pectorale]